MSNVKLHLPFYTKEILLKLMDLIKEETDMRIIHIKDFPKTEKQLYTKLGKFIFDNEDQKLIILGDTGKLNLPIPHISKIIFKHKSVSDARYKFYKKMGYFTVKEKELSQKNKIITMLHSTFTHTGGFSDRYFDVFKLWYLTRNLKQIKFEVSDVMEALFGPEWEEEIHHHKFWRNVKLKNIKKKKHKEHYDRIKNADLKYPIMMTEDNDIFLVDGFHRLLKSYLAKKKYIDVLMIPKSIMKEAEI